jgi:hypothetical protein
MTMMERKAREAYDLANLGGRCLRPSRRAHGLLFASFMAKVDKLTHQDRVKMLIGSIGRIRPNTGNFTLTRWSRWVRSPAAFSSAPAPCMTVTGATTE